MYLCDTTRVWHCVSVWHGSHGRSVCVTPVAPGTAPRCTEAEWCNAETEHRHQHTGTGGRAEVTVGSREPSEQHNTVTWVCCLNIFILTQKISTNLLLPLLLEFLFLLWWREERSTLWSVDLRFEKKNGLFCKSGMEMTFTCDIKYLIAGAEYLKQYIKFPWSKYPQRDAKLVFI